MKKKFSSSVVVFLLLLLICTSGTVAQSKLEIPQADFTEIDNIINQGIKDTAFPGAVVLISKDGENLYEKAYGNFTYDKNSNKVKVNSIFDLASLTKVTAATTAAMICVDRGLFSLDDKVAKYISEFGANKKEEVTRIYYYRYGL